MKKLKFSPLILAVLIYGCATTQTGSDPVVIDAEKATSIGVETINTFLKIEYDNQALVKSKVPSVHSFANSLRIHAPQWIASVRSLTAAYKNNRTPQNKANLETGLAVLQAAITQATQYTTLIGSLH